MKLALIKIAGLSLGVMMGSGAYAADGPNLVPGFSVQTGTVSVKNLGNKDAGRSVATVKCTGQNGATCPDPAPALVAPYLNPAFPNRAALKVPPIKAGQGYSHKLSFFNALVFAPGSYVFTVCVDAGSHVAETNEGDNCRRFVKKVRGRPAIGATKLTQ